MLVFGIGSIVEAAKAGVPRVDDELHLTSLAAQEQYPKIEKLRAALDRRVGEAQLSEDHSGLDVQYAGTIHTTHQSSPAIASSQVVCQ